MKWKPFIFFTWISFFRFVNHEWKLKIFISKGSNANFFNSGHPVECNPVSSHGDSSHSNVYYKWWHWMESQIEHHWFSINSGCCGVSIEESNSVGSLFSKGKSCNPSTDSHLTSKNKEFDSFVWCKSNILLLNCNNLVPHSICHVIANEADALGPDKMKDNVTHLVDTKEAW